MARTPAALAACLALLLFPAGPLSAGQASADLVADLQKALDAGDLEGYLERFSGPAQEAERRLVDSRFREMRMERLTLRRAGRPVVEDSTERLFVHALYQNSWSAILESWRLTVAPTPAGPRITDKALAGSAANLLKVRLPSDRVERAAVVEIRHADIALTFRDALVFRDNVPDQETALLVLGRGTLRFRPSDGVERHLLQTYYGRPELDDELEYVFVRGSDGFFRTHVTVQDARAVPPEALAAPDRARAAAVFDRDYDRSFTIANSIDGGLLSMIPQGDEAVLEFRARRGSEMTYVYSPSAEEEVSLYDRTRDRFVSLYSPGEETPAGTPAPRLKRMIVRMGEQVAVDDIAVELSLQPERAYLSGRARLRLKARSEGVDSVKFRFAPELEILKIEDSRGRDLFYSQDRLRKTLYVYLLDALGRAVPEEVTVTYRGRLVPPPPSTDVAGGPQDLRYAFRERYETWLYSHSVSWYPESLEEGYFTARMRITVPEGYKCVAVGEPVTPSEPPDGQAAFETVVRRPVKALAFLVGRMVRLQSDADEPRLQTFAADETGLARFDPFPESRRILDFYARTFGPFPYVKLDVVRRLHQSAGGHSPATFVVLNELTWIGERPPMPVGGPVNLAGYSEYYLAHEIAHQWWGQAVGWETYRDQWLSEGLAQFASALYLREKYGEREYASILRKFAGWTARASAKGPIRLGSRLSYYDFTSYQAIVYDKAALALQMLSEVLGPETFFRGLRDFYERRRFSLARTDHFVAAMSAAAGRDLQPFFDAWFGSYELPRVRVGADSTHVAGDGFDVRVTVRQLGRAFAYPLSFQWQENQRAVRRTVIVDAPEMQFTFRAAVRPTKFKVDPDRIFPGKVER